MTIGRTRSIKQGATEPPLRGRLTRDDGLLYMNLGPGSGVTAVTITLRGAGTGTVISGAVTVLDDGTQELRGRWERVWANATETGVPDLYEVWFDVTYGPGRVERVPNSGHEHFRIEPL